jgi:hypothetical protein
MDLGTQTMNTPIKFLIRLLKNSDSCIDYGNKPATSANAWFNYATQSIEMSFEQAQELSNARNKAHPNYKSIIEPSNK